MGAVAVEWLEEQGGGTCMQRFCSGGVVGGTWRWNVHLRVLKVLGTQKSPSFGRG